MLTKIASAVVLIFVVSACSGGEEASSGAKPSGDKPSATTPSSKSSSTDAPPKPACAVIWRNGAVLPAGYDGCGKTGGLEESVKCKDGTDLIVFDEAYFAVTGGRITKSQASPLQDTKAYGKAYAACKG